MPAQLAIVASAEWPSCVVRLVGPDELVDAVASPMLEKLWILLRPGDLVMVELDDAPPQVVYRWWHTSVVAVRGTHAQIDPPPSGGQRVPFMQLPSREGFSCTAGDRVFCTRYEVVDVERDGRPTHPEWFGDVFARVHHEVRHPLQSAICDPDEPEGACLYMPAEDPDIDVSLVRRLLRAQLPQWADLPIEQIPSWENAMFRLGEDRSVRLTRGRWALGQIEKERRWLPEFSPQLPLAIPVPVAGGTPGEGYPWPWSVCAWVPGEPATRERLADDRQAAVQLAAFLRALHAIDASDGPVVGRPPHWYGWAPGGFARADAGVRQRLRQLDTAEARALQRLWDDVLSVPLWDGKRVFVHGDLDESNILAADGRLTGVIDFGVLSTGDPAMDYQVAWKLFGPEARAVFRDTLRIDDEAWTRARGYAMWTGQFDEILADGAP